MSFFETEAWTQVFVSSLTELGTTLARFLPNLLGMILILAAGWIIARLVRAITQRGLQRAGLDSAAERASVATLLRSAEIRSTPSELLGWLLFWVLMLTFVLSAFETLGLSAVTRTIDRLIGYLPNVIAALLIVVLGLIAARLLANLVRSTASATGLPYAGEVASAAHGTAVLMVALLAVEQLGVDTALLVTLVVVIVAAAAGALGLAFALGARHVVGGVLAGHYLRRSYSEGDHIEVEGRSGVIERVGPTDTLIRDGDSRWSIPNDLLLGSTVRRES